MNALKNQLPIFCAIPGQALKFRYSETPTEIWQKISQLLWRPKRSVNFEMSFGVIFSTKKPRMFLKKRERDIQKLAGMIWKRCSKQNWWNMLYLRVIPRKSRFYIKSQFWKSFHWGHFLSKDQLVPVAQWAKIFSEEGPYSIFLHFYKKFVQFP